MEAPIDFPSITINGRALVVKIDFLAKYRMAQLGINGEAFRLLVPGNQDPAVVELLMKLFTCAVANNFVDVARPAAPAEIPTPEYWAAVIPPDQWQEVCNVTMQAMLKAIPPAAARPLAETESGNPRTN